MAVTINHGYAPSRTDKSVQYTYNVAVDSTYAAQLVLPAYYDGVMQFGGGDVYLTEGDIVYDMTSCEYTDTSNDVWKFYVEYDANRYHLKYTINNGTPAVIVSSDYPIYFGWCAASGFWAGGVMPGFQADLGGRAKFVTGTPPGTQTAHFDGGRVRVSQRVTISQTCRIYEVQETTTVTNA